ncbi:MAG: polyketide cyclase [Bdellovibrionaceae bacterium]|mgnify:CR=1 FL=1|jgi:coenzyme Q-binding protein COQ10|nr:polyketide cyclase [Pseudobdellovibrionaceae bacterium]
MASAETTEVFNCTKDEFFKIISDYEKYPEFLAEVKECSVVETDGDKKLVKYSVSVIKSFSYQLWMKEEGTDKISWVFDSGDIFKLSNGSWELKEVDGGKVQAHYKVEAKFKGFVPSPIAKGLVSVNLPNMISSYHKRIKEVYGK